MLAAIASLYGLYQINNPRFAGGELSDITFDPSGAEFNVNFNVAIKGYPAGEKCEVRWTVYDDKIREKLPGPKFQGQTYVDPGRYWTKYGSFTFPIPEEPGDYYVKLKLFPPDKSGESKPLDVAKSEGFDSG